MTRNGLSDRLIYMDAVGVELPPGRGPDIKEKITRTAPRSRVGILAQALFAKESEHLTLIKRQKGKEKGGVNLERVGASKLVIGPMVAEMDRLKNVARAEKQDKSDQLVRKGGAYEMVTRNSGEGVVLSNEATVALDAWTPEGMATWFNQALSSYQMPPRLVDVWGYPGEWKFDFSAFSKGGGMKVEINGQELKLSYKEATNLRRVFYTRLGVALAHYIFAALGEVEGAIAQSYKKTLERLTEGGELSWWNLNQNAALTAGIQWPDLPGDWLTCDPVQLKDWKELASTSRSFGNKADKLLKPKGEQAKKEIRPVAYTKKQQRQAGRKLLELLAVYPEDFKSVLEEVRVGDTPESKGMDWLVEMKPEVLRVLSEGRLAQLKQEVAKLSGSEAVEKLDEELTRRVELLRSLANDLESISTDLEDKKLQLQFAEAQRERGALESELNKKKSGKYKDVEVDVEDLEAQIAGVDREISRLGQRLEQPREEEVEKDKSSRKDMSF